MRKPLTPTVVHDIFVRQGCGAWQPLVERLAASTEEVEVTAGWFCRMRGETPEDSSPWLGPCGTPQEAADLLLATHEEDVAPWAAFFAAVREMR